jgi:hypothetical protein
MRDVKEVVGILMRVLGGAEITEAEVLDLEFEADDELQEVLNETFVKLLEFLMIPACGAPIVSSTKNTGPRCRTY